MRVNRRTAAKLLAVAPAVGAEAFADQPEPEREWLGPDYWTNPLQDWKLANGRLECRVSGGDRNVFLLTKEVADRPGDLSFFDPDGSYQRLHAGLKAVKAAS